MGKQHSIRNGMLFGIVVLFVGATVFQSISGATTSGTENASAQPIMTNYASLPVVFTENVGQFPEDVIFQTQVADATVYLCEHAVVSVLPHPSDGRDQGYADVWSLPEQKTALHLPAKPPSLVIRAVFVNTNPQVAIRGIGEVPHRSNYFKGNNPDHWYTDVRNYETVYYENVYDGIDLRYYGTHEGLKYDYLVAPSANPDQIRIAYEEIDAFQVTKDGDLFIETGGSGIQEKNPVAYQLEGNHRREIRCDYEVVSDRSFGFTVYEDYNPALPLVIDPVMVYSTYLGGTGYDEGMSMTVDESGNTYITGYTKSLDFPTKNPYDASLTGSSDVFVTKLSPTLPSLKNVDSVIYSTYLGGTSGDLARGITVDTDGNIYLTGDTASYDFPTVDPYDDSFEGGYWPIDAFVAKLSPMGNSLLYSTFLGGIDWDHGGDITVDATGNAYVTGVTLSPDFPTRNAYDDSFNDVSVEGDAYVAKFAPHLGGDDSLIYSTFLGGEAWDYGVAIGVDDEGHVSVSGETSSPNFPTANPYDTSFNGDAFDAFVTVFSPVGDTLLYSTYLGGTGDETAMDIDLDNEGNVFITGPTRSTNFPMVNPYDDSANGWNDVFVAVLSPFIGGVDSLRYSTYLGGPGQDLGSGIAVDENGNAYITGDTFSPGFPVVNYVDGSFNGWHDAFVAKFSPSVGGGDSLVYSTFLGGTAADEGIGIAVDKDENVYILGNTGSEDFPTVKNSYDTSYNGGHGGYFYDTGDVFIVKYASPAASQPPDKPGKPSGPRLLFAGRPHVFTTTAIDPNGDNLYYMWDWGDGTYSGWLGPYASGEPAQASHAWTDAWTYRIKVSAKDDHGYESVWSDPFIVNIGSIKEGKMPPK